MFLIPLLTLKENGGVAVALAFARQAAAKGERVVVLASSFHGTKAVRDPENFGIEFVIARPFRGGRIGALLSFYLHAVAWSAWRRPQLVYTHIATSVIPNFSGRRSFMIAQDIEYRFFSGTVRAIAKRVFDRAIRNSSLIVSSLWLARYFRRHGCDIAFAGDVGISQRMIRENAVDKESPREFDFLLIAKRGAHKRHAETMQVARALALDGNVVRLIDQAPDESAQSGRSNLICSGAVSAETMRRLYGQTRVFVGASKAEGYGLTPLEALSQGCRVVTTPTPSTARLKSGHLDVVTGSDELVGRLVAAARLALNAHRGELAAGPEVPCMEDWSAAAYQAFSIARSQ